MKAAIYPKVIDQKESTLVLGSFESFHNGHLKLIEKAKTFKKPISIMLIQNPEDIPGHNKTLYATIETRLQNIASLKVAKATVVKFTDELRLTEGKKFIQQVVKATNASQLVVGEDFACGIGREYTAKKIKADFPTTIVDEYKINGKKLGTSILKEMVRTGEMSLIKEVSPFSYTVRERVTNKNTFKFNNTIKPHAGIYVIDAIVNDMRFWGFAHINMKGEGRLYLEDFNLVNSDYDAIISFHKLSRIIVSSNKDKVEDADRERILNYFRA